MTEPASPSSQRPSAICVFCGSSPGFDPAHRYLAQRLGAALAEAGHTLIYGGGHVGLMGEVADAVLAAGGSVVGVMTEDLVAAEIAHRGLTKLEITPDMHARKARMAELSDGVIVLPGGFGTWEEALEQLTWTQLGIDTSPVVFLDADGFYDPLFALFDQAVEAGFLKTANRDLARRATSAQAAVTAALAPLEGWTPKWQTATGEDLPGN
jgi:uncharacterized protein (TIGR00730 family)